MAYIPLIGSLIIAYDPRTGYTATVKVTAVHPAPNPNNMPQLEGTSVDGSGHYLLAWSFAKNSWVIFGTRPV